MHRRWPRRVGEAFESKLGVPHGLLTALELSIEAEITEVCDELSAGDPWHHPCVVDPHRSFGELQAPLLLGAPGSLPLLPLAAEEFHRLRIRLHALPEHEAHKGVVLPHGAERFLEGLRQWSASLGQHAAPNTAANLALTFIALAFVLDEAAPLHQHGVPLPAEGEILIVHHLQCGPVPELHHPAPVPVAAAVQATWVRRAESAVGILGGPFHPLAPLRRVAEVRRRCGWQVTRAVLRSIVLEGLLMRKVLGDELRGALAFRLCTAQGLFGLRGAVAEPLLLRLREAAARSLEAATTLNREAAGRFPKLAHLGHRTTAGEVHEAKRRRLPEGGDDLAHPIGAEPSGP
mmetsp:Transcript_51998/g.111270  ORF Transcript_51998/g.111270 Transcript_51998/m.111270 type:complete len:347 (+) Transcript_51998:539-1579(+)